MPLSAGAKLGPYEIVRPLGSGGMGDVYVASDPRLGRQVAIKVLALSSSSDPSRVRRFEQESRVVGMLNHPNIVTVYDVGTDGTSPYLVAELVDGDTLRQKLHRGALPLERALYYAAQVARGLAAAHAKGIVHRDLKPENIIIDRGDQAKILDFGVAKLMEPVSGQGDEIETQSALTRVGEIVGTLAYMSPEQLTGSGADQRSDLFSLGSILYEMVSGQRAFRGTSPPETAAAILKDEPVVTGDVHAGVAAVVRRLLAKNPNDRYQSAGDLAFQLEGLLMRPAPATPPRPTRRTLWAAGVVTFLTVAIGVGTRFASPPDPPASYERLTFRRGSIHSARFAPDGQTVIYNATWEGATNELFETRVGSPESRPLGHGDANLMAVSATGELAIALRPQRGGLRARGTLARVGSAGNAPRLLFDNVVAADWSAAGDLGAVHIVDSKYRVEFPIGTRLYETADPVAGFRVAPDGSRVALFEGSSLVIIERSGERKLLSTGWAIVDKLAWKPNGREVWFSAARFVPTIATAAIYAVTLDGSLRTVAQVPGGVSLLDISRDGRVLVSTSESSKGLRFYSAAMGVERDLAWFDWGLVADVSSDLKFVLFSEGGHAAGRDRATYLRSTDGSPAVRLSDGSAQSLSPDGTRALVVKSIGTSRRLVSIPTGTGGERSLTDERFDCSSAGWFGDGKRIVFAARESSGPLRSYAVSADGGAPEPITPEGVAGTLVSPDGRWLLAARAGEAYALYPVAAGPPRTVASLEAEDQPVRWSKDGRSIYVRRDFQSDNPNVIDVFRVDVSSGRRELWKRIRPTEFARLADLLPVAIASDERSYAYTYWRSTSDLYLIDGLR